MVSAHVPVVLGSSHACTFCIIPYRRGVERSRSVGEIVTEVRSLVAQGVKEITLLGQIVDRYGKDIPAGPDLAALLRIVHDVEQLERIRFLTSHPNWMSDELLMAVAELKLDVAHLARYSSRPGTVADRRLEDDVPDEEKWACFRALEELQAQFSEEVNGGYLGKTIAVLFEGEVRGRWKGRTVTNKLVFVESDESLRDENLPATLTWTGLWSMKGRLTEGRTISVPLPMVSTSA